MTPPTGIPALDALLAQTNGATALPFRYDAMDRCVYDARGYLFAQIDDPQNAALMVASVNALPALAAECRRLVERLEAAEYVCACVRAEWHEGEMYYAINRYNALRAARGGGK